VAPNQERTQTETETERNENISLFAQKQSKEYNNVKTRNRVELEREQGSNGRTQTLRNDDGSMKRRTEKQVQLNTALNKLNIN
jgi:hypothetical protein